MNNIKFTTLDQDNDLRSGVNCAIRTNAGWWHKSCSCANPNGLYLRGENLLGNEGVTYVPWRCTLYSMKATQMMFRRVCKVMELCGSDGLQSVPTHFYAYFYNVNFYILNKHFVCISETLTYNKCNDVFELFKISFSNYHLSFCCEYLAKLVLTRVGFITYHIFWGDIGHFNIVTYFM